MVFGAPSSHTNRNERRSNSMPASSPSRSLNKPFRTRATAPIRSKEENGSNEIVYYAVSFACFCWPCLRQRCEDRNQGQRDDVRRVRRQCQERIDESQRRQEC